MTIANVYIRQILLKRGNTASASQYVGPLGEVVLDTDLQTIRVQDGVTPGGNVQLVNTSTINTINSNVAAANLAIANLSSELSTVLAEVYTNANVSAYLPVYGGNLLIGNIEFSDNTVQTTAYTGNYTAANANVWNGTAPTTISSAIDRLAAAIKALNGTGA